MSKNLKLSMILIILVTTLITTGFTFFNRTPKTVYRVYLKGESLGLIESKKDLENYIDKKQTEIKEDLKTELFGLVF